MGLRSEQPNNCALPPSHSHLAVRTSPRIRCRAVPFPHRAPVPCAHSALPPAVPHPIAGRTAPPSRTSTLSTGTQVQEEIAAGLDFISRGRKGRPAHAGLFVLNVPSRPELASYRIPQPGRPWLSATPCLKCFRRFQLMFQVFHLNVAKVNIGCCICCNGNMRMLQANVSSVSDVCLKCFIWMF
jgi:hypothetical protein